MYEPRATIETPNTHTHTHTHLSKPSLRRDAADKVIKYQKKKRKPENAERRKKRVRGKKTTTEMERHIYSRYVSIFAANSNTPNIEYNKKRKCWQSIVNDEEKQKFGRNK